MSGMKAPVTGSEEGDAGHQTTRRWVTPITRQPSPPRDEGHHQRGQRCSPNARSEANEMRKDAAT